MYQILYKLSNNLTYHLYWMTENVDMKLLKQVQSHVSKQNNSSKVNVIAVDDQDRVVMSVEKLTKEDKDEIAERQGWKLKRGI